MMMKNKRLRDGAASDEFGDYEAFIEYLQELRKIKYYADSDNWCDCQGTFNNIYKKGCLEDDGYEKAQHALKEIAI